MVKSEISLKMKNYLGIIFRTLILVFFLFVVYFYFEKAFETLLVEKTFTDLAARWQDFRNILSGVIPSSGGYFPFSFFTAAIFFLWPSSHIFLIGVYIFWNLISLTVIGLWLVKITSTKPIFFQIFSVLSSFAICAMSGSIGRGQFGLFVIASLVGSLWLSENKMKFGSGLLLGCSMIKPSLAMPFVFVFLNKKKYGEVIAAGIYNFLGGIFLCMATKINYFDWLKIAYVKSERFALTGYSLINLFVWLGMNISGAIWISMFIVTFFFGWIMVKNRKSEIMFHFAMAALGARLWSYHQYYDNCILIFLLQSLFLLMLNTKSKLALWGFLLVGLLLWAPNRFADNITYQIFQTLSWIVGMYVLMTHETALTKLGFPNHPKRF